MVHIFAYFKHALGGSTAGGVITLLALCQVNRKARAIQVHEEETDNAQIRNHPYCQTKRRR